MNNLTGIDYAVFIFYFILISVTWWAIGASLIASNISAEQFIGMSGQGFQVGIAVAAYEWVAAIALIIVAVWFIPVYLKNKIYTMPQFLQTRYNETVSLIMAVFWLFLYIFVNLTSILYLGSIAISSMVDPMYFKYIVLGLAAFSLLITLGGMKVIGFTDVIQVVVLIVGGLVTTYIALTMVSDHFGLGRDAIAGFKMLMKDSPDHFKLTFLPTGLKGLSLAALTAAIVASLAGKANSISTIWTLDIYKKYINKAADDKKLVVVGRWSILAAIIVSVILTWDDLLGIGGEGGFTFIQKYTGFISPGVFAMFILGMFWKRTTGTAAIAGLVTGFLLSVVFNNYAPTWFGPDNFLYTAYINKDGVYEIPFLICMGLSFMFTMIVMVSLSLLGPKVNPKAFELDKSMFKVAPSTLVLIVITLLMITLIYVKFW
ncbi:MAG: sodium transporter [Acinetobacter sp.]|nr:MAG: sodium transporter [Acinetobacter sp.]